MRSLSALTVLIALGIGCLAGCSSTPEAKTPSEAATQLTKKFADEYVNDVELGTMFCSGKSNVEKLPERLARRKSDVSKIENVAPDASHTPAPGHHTFTSVLNVSGEFSDTKSQGAIAWLLTIDVDEHTKACISGTQGIAPD